MKLKVVLTSAVLVLLMASFAGAQIQAAVATPVVPSIGRPSSFQIRQNFFAIQQANISRSLRQVERCLADAVNPQVLRDPEGNLNRVPRIDLNTCSYQLRLLQRQLARLAREQAKEAQDAGAAASFLEFTRRQAQLQQTLRALSGRAPTARIVR
jgi:hypothetical protein